MLGMTRITLKEGACPSISSTSAAGIPGSATRPSSAAAAPVPTSPSTTSSVTSTPSRTIVVVVTATTDHPRVASKSYDFSFVILARLPTLIFGLWWCILEFLTVLAGILDSCLKLWTLVPAAAATAAATAASGTI